MIKRQGKIHCKEAEAITEGAEEKKAKERKNKITQTNTSIAAVALHNLSLLSNTAGNATIPTPNQPSNEKTVADSTASNALKQIFFRGNCKNGIETIQ